MKQKDSRTPYIQSFYTEWLQHKKQSCWKLIAAQYPEATDKYGVARAMMERTVKAGDVVLDAGCGHETIRPPVPVTLIGLDAVAEDVARNTALDVRLVGDMDEITLQNHTVDLITLNMVAEHLQHPARVVHELARVLKPGGSIILMTPSAWNIVTLIARCLPNWLLPKLALAMTGTAESDTFPTYYRANTRGTLCRLMAQAGIVEQEVLHYQPPPYAFVFSKLVCRLMIAYYHLLNRFACLGPLRGVIIARYVKGA